MRCFFNLVSDYETIYDSVGIDIDDVEAAQLEAIDTIRELVSEGDEFLQSWEGWYLNVVDEANCLIWSCPVSNLPRQIH